MKAIRLYSNGSSTSLKMEEVLQPAMAEDHVLIRSAAIGLNGGDVGRRRNPQPFEPTIVGYDVAGTVEGVGAKVKGFRLGDRVMALARSTYAEYVVAAPALTAQIPAEMSFTDAAAVPCAALTAWHGLTTIGRMKAGDLVVIHAAGSGVGMFGTQIAQALGGKVIGTAGSQSKLDRAKDLGATIGIDYSKDDVGTALLRLTNGRGVDVVLDSVGGAIFDATLRALAPGGRVVNVGVPGGQRGAFDQEALDSKGQKVLQCSVFAQAAEDLEGKGWTRLLGWFKDGTVKILVEKVLPWTEVEEAQQLLLGRAVFGKLVITVG